MNINILNPQFISKLRKVMSTFTQKLNPLNGTSDWVFQNENYDYHQEVARAAFADMLHDTERNQMYEMGLKAAINHIHSLGMAANVLDIGTGTGLLAMMAARNGADTIYACEAFRPMSQCALEIIRQNNFSDRIIVIPKRSTELKIGPDLPQRANILVTEVFDTELIGEGAISTFNHAHAHLLESNCIVIPHSATIYAQVVECPLANSWNEIKDIYDVEGHLLIQVPEVVKNCQGSAAVHDVQLSQLPYQSFNVLSEPIEVFKFDFSGKTDLKYLWESNTELTSHRTATAQVVFMWWELNMDINNEVVLSCAPYWAHYKFEKDKRIPWRDHWMQAVYYLPKEVRLNEGGGFTLLSGRDEYSLWFNIVSKNDEITTEHYSCPRCECNLHLAFSRTRIGQLNDGTRQKKLLSVLESNIDSNSVVLAVGDCFYLALAAIKFGAKKLFILDSDHITRRVLSSFLVKNELLDTVTIIEGCKDLQGMEEKINIVLGEPYFISSILPWDNLMFLYKINAFRTFFSEDVKIFPRDAKIKAVAVQFENLHKIRSPLTVCEGFKMEAFDKLIDVSSLISDDNVEAQPLWEYPCIALSPVEELCHLDFQLGDVKKIQSCQTFHLKNDLACNGIAVWVDWYLDESSRSFITTGPIHPIEIGEKITWDIHTRQGVCLLGSKPIKNVVKTCFNFDYEEANISFKVL